MESTFIVDAGLITGIIICLLITAGQLLLKRKDQKNYLIATNTFLVAVYQFSVAFYLFPGLENWYEIYPWVYATGRFALFSAAPMYYFFFKSLPQKEFRFHPKQLLHLITPAAVTIILVLFADYPVAPCVTPRAYKDFLYSNGGIFHPLSIFSSFYGFAYFFFILVYYIHLFRKSADERKKNLTTVIIFSIIIIAPLFPYVIFGNRIEWFNHLFQMRFSIFSIYLILLSQRYPFLLNIIKLEAYRDYYLNSSIEDSEAKRVLLSLEQLMDEGKVFTDNELTIKKTADMLKISAIQLSEVLNIYHKKTFSIYIKEKRISYSLKLLVSNPEKTILDIALECGFNSKSSYYSSFKTMIGETPLQYRNNNIS